eukprot:TRINITY_DN572_c0_g1_i3.p1 TRINITY_DN572_c0_g1~~TRINITY_DN572_c0_g1_i3.p1  ORF type:complete len:380 (-),score=22.06 TRINITY_DN572_c0_g1_i3:790-1821(-)
MEEEKVKELEYETYEYTFPFIWDQIYLADSKRIEKQESPTAIKNILDFVHRNVGSSYILLFSEFYANQKTKAPKIPYGTKLPLLPAFNPQEWNFTKAPKEQFIGRFGPHYLLTSSNPLCKYHSIFVVFFNSEISQVITEPKVILPVLHLLAGSKREDARIYFNGYAAGASVNHFHYQLVYTKELCNVSSFPIETVPGNTLIRSVHLTDNSMEIYENISYPLPFFKFSATSLLSSSLASELAQVLHVLVELIYASSCSLNILFSNFGRTVYVIPRKKQEKLEVTPIGDGAIECAGIGSCFSSEAFAKCDKEMYENHIKQYAVCLSEFTKIKPFDIFIYQIINKM